MAKKNLEIEKEDELEVEAVPYDSSYPAVFNKGGLFIEPVYEDSPDRKPALNKLKKMLKK